jgi:hypothetical protein
LKSFLIRLLGGVSAEKYKQLEFKNGELNNQVSDLTPYKEFATSIYRYAGNYPAWKAQCEYREGLFNLGFPLGVKHLQNDGKHMPSHLEYVDIYLGRVVDSFSALLEKVGHPIAGITSECWKVKDELDIVRGTHWLISEHLEENHNVRKSSKNPTKT